MATGGRGGSIYFIADHNLHTLLDFKMKQHYKAPKGENGQSSNKIGKSGKDIYLRVPLGTIVRFDGQEEVFADLVEDGQKVKVVSGGRGGKGNTRSSVSLSTTTTEEEEKREDTLDRCSGHVSAVGEEDFAGCLEISGIVKVMTVRIARMMLEIIMTGRICRGGRCFCGCR